MAQSTKKIEPDRESQDSSDQGTKLGKIEDKDEYIFQLKRKLKSLRDAFKKERELMGNLENQFAEFKTRNETLEVTLKDKEYLIASLQKENLELQERVTALKNKIETASSFKDSGKGGSDSGSKSGGASFGHTLGSSLGEMFGFKGGQSDAKKLQVEYNYLRKQFDTVKDRLLKSEEEKDLIKKELKKEIDTLQMRLKHAEEDLAEKKQEAENLDKLYNTVNQAHTKLKDLYSHQETELQYLKSRYDTLAKERDHYKNSVDEKSKLLDEKNQLLEQLEAQTRILGEKKINLEQIIREKDNYIADQESRLQVFPVTRKTLMDSPAQILLRKDVEGDFVLDIETLEERKILFPYQITAISPNKENTNLFTISYRVKTNKTEEEAFESKDAVKLLKSLKKFMENAREKAKNEPAIHTKGDSGQKKDKHFFKEIAGFFGS